MIEAKFISRSQKPGLLAKKPGLLAKKPGLLAKKPGLLEKETRFNLKWLPIDNLFSSGNMFDRESVKHRRSQDLQRGVVLSKIPDFHGQFKKKFW
jgi:hypothetical protein